MVTLIGEPKHNVRRLYAYEETGAAIGMNAAFLNIITEWLSDVKLGYCTTAFYLNESFCCWGESNGMIEKVSYEAFC